MNYKQILISFLFILIAPSLSAQEITRLEQLRPSDGPYLISFKPNVFAKHYFINDQRVSKLLFEGVLNDDQVVYDQFEKIRRRGNYGKTIAQLSALTIISGLLTKSVLNESLPSNYFIYPTATLVVGGGILYYYNSKLHSILNTYNKKRTQDIGLLIHSDGIGLSLSF